MGDSRSWAYDRENELDSYKKIASMIGNADYLKDERYSISPEKQKVMDKVGNHPSFSDLCTLHDIVSEYDIELINLRKQIIALEEKIQHNIRKSDKVKAMKNKLAKEIKESIFGTS